MRVWKLLYQPEHDFWMETTNQLNIVTFKLEFSNT